MAVQEGNKPMVYEAVDVESAEFLVPRSPKVWGWRLMVGSVAAVGVVALIAVVQLAPQPARSPLEHLTNMQDKLMSAFVSRALTDTSDFNLAYEITLNEEGASDPDAMGVRADMKVGDASNQWPQMTVTFAAVKGKQDDLYNKLKKVWADVVDMEKKQSGQSGADHLEKLASLSKCDDGEGVLLKVRFPKGPAESADDKKLMEDFKEHHPTFHAELSFGRTIKQMYDNANTNMVELPHGIYAKVGAGIARTVFDMIGDAVPRDVVPMLGIMKGFSSFSASEKMIYKKNTGRTFDKIPSLKKEVADLKQAVQRGPKGLTQHLEGLDALMTGISSVAVTGLPLGWELDAKFKHFHPAPVLASMV